MWSSVEDEFANLLTSRVFHTLSEDPAYVALFRNAGFQGKLPADLTRAPAAVLERLKSSVKLCAQLLMMDIEAKKSLRERRAKAVVVQGSVTLYRLWSSTAYSRIGPWWFTAGLLDEAIAECNGDRAKTLEWLRDRLAISLDFSSCDRLAALSLGASSAVPAIEAWGLPMRKYSSGALQNDPNLPSSEYFSKRDQWFQGMKTQYFLPFVPASRVTDRW